MIPFQLTDCNQRKILTADVCQILKDLRSLAPIGIQINHRLVWRGTFEYIYFFCSTEKEFILPPPHHWRMLRKLRGSESPAPVPSYLYSPLVPPYFCAYIVFEISTKVNFCFIYTAYTGGDFPLGRLACHVQKMQLDDQPVTGTAARRVPSSHKQYCTVSAACFWRSCKNNNTPGQLHKCKLSGRVLRFLSEQTHHHCAQVIPVEDKRRRLNRWLGK